MLKMKCSGSTAELLYNWESNVERGNAAGWIYGHT